MDVIREVQTNYHLPDKARTIGEMLAEARQQSGAAKLAGHDIMALERCHFFSLLIKRYGHLKIPTKEQKKTQKNRSRSTSIVKRPLFVQFDCSVNGCLDDRQVFFRAEL